MKDWSAYIDSLVQPGEKLTRKDWISWIQKEAKDYSEDINEDDIVYILNALEKEDMIDYSYEAAVALMDDDIREELHREIAPCTDEEFLKAYKKRHLEKYGEEFTI